MPSELDFHLHSFSQGAPDEWDFHFGKAADLLTKGARVDLNSIKVLFMCQEVRMSEDEEDELYRKRLEMFMLLLASGYDPLNAEPSIFDKDNVATYWHESLGVLKALSVLEEERGVKLRTPEGGTALHKMLQTTEGLSTLSCICLESVLSENWIDVMDQKGNTALNTIWERVEEGEISINIDTSLVSMALQRFGFDPGLPNHEGVSAATRMFNQPLISMFWENADEYYSLPAGTTEQQMRGSIASFEAKKIDQATPTVSLGGSKPRF